MSNIPFIYREKLNIPQNIKFGLESELDKIDPDEVYKLVRKEFGNTWIIKEDKGLTKGENRELVSPVLTNTIEVILCINTSEEDVKSSFSLLE